jgi:hypothetical protein
MRAKEMIKVLEKLCEEYGDLPVRYDSKSGDAPACELVAYDEKGNHPTDDKPAVEFYIH